MKSSHAYRERIYARYTSEKMPAVLSYSEADYHRWAKACQTRIKRWLPKDKDAVCLDLGCGPGNVLYLLRLEGYQNVRGVDISREQVEVARQICPNVEQADVRDYLRQFRAHFDLITAFDLIEHFHKDELCNLLDAICYALKPGGILVIQTPNAESPWGLMHRYHDFTHELAFDPHSLEHVLGIAGFTDFEISECGPHVHGVRSLIRLFLWKAIWAALALWNLAEMGHLGSGVYTRIFVAKAEKPVEQP
jgi:SAM-dependent methyltransferase